MSTLIQSHVVWSLPLQGRQLIEASAGTGKTWTLTGLVVRLVLGLRQMPPHGEFGTLEAPLMPPQILVVTFTEAATAELRDRVHDRLARAVQVFAQPDLTDAQIQDDFLCALRQCIPKPQWQEAQRRLTQALAGLDEAAIYTLHGWALRTLKRHAFESGPSFGATPVPHSLALHLEVIMDFWRCHLSAQPVNTLRFWVQEVAAQPHDLLNHIRPLWAEHERDPHHAWPLVEGALALRELTQWGEHLDEQQRRARAAFDPQCLDALRTAIETRAIKGYPLNWWPSRLRALQRWLAGENLALNALSYWGAHYLHTREWADTAQWPFFSAVQDLCDALKTPATHLVTPLLSWAAQETWTRLQERKLALNQFEFNDLLRRLHAACHDADSDFCAKVRQTHPVALVDEFQDTDPWQYESLAAIYPQEDSTPHCWVMIGDPKQSIYRFRGADLPTYQRARKTANATHRLAVNFRSTPAMVSALNQIFQQPSLSLLEHSSAQVAAGQPKRVGLNDNQHPAVWVAHLRNETQEADSKTPLLSRAQFHEQMAQLAANTLVTHLQQDWYKPNQVAILVRSKTQARIMSAALQARGLTSVYLSDRNSILSEPIAQEVWRLLCAFDQPQSLTHIRAAMATAVWAIPAQSWVTPLLSDEALQTAQALCHQAQILWMRQGVLAALTHWLHASGAAQRLFSQPQGERLMGQFMHLAQWLESVCPVGSAACTRSSLLRRFTDEMQSPNLDDAAAQARLHTDSACVNLVTVHKSKGLEYDVVFIPFLSTLSQANRATEAEPSEDEAEDANTSEDTEPSLEPALQQAEDLRLLYVALTRARLHLWLGVAEVKGEWGKLHERRIEPAVDDQPLRGKAKAQLAKYHELNEASALCALLQRQGPGDLLEALKTHWSHSALHIETRDMVTEAAIWNPPPTPALRPALVAPPARRALWRMSSYSALTRDLEDTPLSRAADEGAWQAQPHEEANPNSLFMDQGLEGLPDWRDLGAGRALGVAIHEWLEWQCLHAWPLAKDPLHPASLQHIDRMALAWQLSPEAKARLTERLRELVHAPLALPPWLAAPQLRGGNANDLLPRWNLTLSQLCPPRAWAEMPFTLGLGGFDAASLDRAAQRAIAPGEPRPALEPQRFNGLLTGVMDLVFSFHGPNDTTERYAVLDYKTNRIADVRPQTLLRVVLEHRYDVQALVYALALYRLLKHRYGHQEAKVRLTGVMFWFVRGLALGAYWVQVPTDIMTQLDEEWQT